MIINKLTIKCPFSTSKLPLQLDLSFNIIFLSDKALPSPDVRKRTPQCTLGCKQGECTAAPPITTPPMSVTYFSAQ